jgi:hypothetical protein
MRKLVEVQEAKALMHEAMDWSVFKWLLERSRVRETADQAKAALDASEQAVKARWSSGIKAAYKMTANVAKAPRNDQADLKPEQSLNPAILALVESVVVADDAAEHAGIDAEDTFDQAERSLSVTMARDGCRKAIHAWALREKAIRKAEAVADTEAASARLAPEEQ